MRLNRLYPSIPAARQPCHPEAGFLLAGSGMLILIVVAMLGSFAFVLTRNSHYHANYATGQRIAEMTTLAHFYAQQTAYAPVMATPGSPSSQY